MENAEAMDGTETTCQHNVSVKIVKADGVIEMSPALLDGEILNVTYNEYLPRLDVETKGFVPTCLVTLTCDRRFINESVATSLLVSLKTIIERPDDLLL